MPNRTAVAVGFRSVSRLHLTYHMPHEAWWGADAVMHTILCVTQNKRTGTASTMQLPASVLACCVTFATRWNHSYPGRVLDDARAAACNCALAGHVSQPRHTQQTMHRQTARLLHSKVASNCTELLAGHVTASAFAADYAPLHSQEWSCKGLPFTPACWLAKCWPAGCEAGAGAPKQAPA